MHFSIFVFRVRSTMLSFTSWCENNIPVLIPPTEEHFDSIRRRGFPNIASALLHRVSCKHRTSETSEPPEAFSFWLLYFNILHKVTVLFVLSLYFVYPCWPTLCFCVWVFGCLGVWERDTRKGREREYTHAREASIKRAITFARKTILVTYSLEIFLRFCFLSIFLKKLKFQVMVFQRSPTDSFQVMNESRKTLSGMRKGLWEQGWYSILIKILNKLERGSTKKQ